MDFKETFWTKNTFLVTGGAGFLGTHLIKGLKERGAEFIHAPRQEKYDLRYEEDIVDMLYYYDNPTVVIHLAAVVGGIGANRARPAEFFYDNMIMGTQLLHHSYMNGVKKFVTIGTVCSYPKFTDVPFVEEDLWEGYPEETNAPYGIAKKALLVQGQAYREQYGFNSIYLIPTNLYGPGDNFNPSSSHVIPALIKKFVLAKENEHGFVYAWGTGTPTREFLYVEDAVRGILLATERYNSSEPINLGTGSEISISSLTKMIAEVVGFKGDIIWDISKPDGQPRRSLDTTKAGAEFGFVANKDFYQGLKETVAWYLENRQAI